MRRRRETIWFIPPDEVLTLRTSLIKMFLRCPAQALFRYFKGLVVLPNSFMTFGSCFHKTAEYQNRYKHRKGRDAKLSVLQDVFYEEFRKRRDKAKTRWLKKEDPRAIEKEGIKRVVPVYHEKLAKRTEPKLVEQEFKIKIPKYNLRITGTMDLVDIHRTIIDYKTKSRSPQWDEAMKSTQGKLYQLGYKTKYGRESRGFGLDCIIRKIHPEVKRLKPHRMGELEEEAFIHMLGQVATQIRLGAFYPRREGNFFCSKNSCGYYEICLRGAWRKLPSGVVYNKNIQVGEEDDE